MAAIPDFRRPVADPACRPPRAGLLAIGVALVGLGLALQACSAAPTQPRSQTRSEAADFRGTRYPAPTPLPPGPAQPTPVAGEPDLPPIRSPETRRTADLADLALSRALENAAIRDQETEMLVRRYFAVVESVYQVAAVHQPASANELDRYDPIPLWRVHAQLAPELQSLTRRAAVLQERFGAMASDLSIRLAGEVDEPGRSGRIRYFFRVCACIERDAGERSRHGEAYLAAQRDGASDDDLRAAEPVQVRYVQDMQLLARTVECTRLATRSFVSPLR